MGESVQRVSWLEHHAVVALPRTVVPGDSVVGVRGRSHCVFRPTHLVVPRSVAPHFEVRDFKVGKNSQFWGEGPVHAECFGGDLDAFSLDRDAPENFLKKVALDVPLPLRLDVCTPDHVLFLEVQNLDSCARNFWAALYGTLVE